MTTTGTLPQAIRVNRGLVVAGAALAGVGSILAAAGIMLEGYALVSVSRQWVQQLQTPPNEIARRKLQQVRTVGSAAAEAWRSNNARA